MTQMTLPTPMLEDIAILPLVLPEAETYGIEVRFTWAPTFDFAQFLSEVDANFELEKAFVARLTQEIRASESYRKFDGNRPMVEIEIKNVALRIPKLDTLLFEDWIFEDFTQDGGSVSGLPPLRTKASQSTSKIGGGTNGT